MPVAAAPRRLDDQQVPGSHLGGIAAGAFRITTVYTGDGVALEPPGRRPVDSHLWIRPSALLLLMFRRRSLASVVARRESFVWGRRPWTALEPLKAVPRV